MSKLTLFIGGLYRELEPSAAMSARPVSLLTGEGAFLVPLMYVGAVLRSDVATSPDNGALLASIIPRKTGVGVPAGR